MRVKTIIAILIIALSLGGMYWWETYGRDSFSKEEVLVASMDIDEGTQAQQLSFKIAKLDVGSVLPGALKPSDASKLYGLEATQNIVADQQILGSYFQEHQEVEYDGREAFSIRNNWIYERSRDLSNGDWVEIYAMATSEDPEKEPEYLGCFEVSAVVDVNEHLTVESGEMINSFEILCQPEEYFNIYTAAREGEMHNEKNIVAMIRSDK